MSEAEIVPTFGLLLLAGSETTARLLSAATFYLLTNQRLLKKLVTEIRTTFTRKAEITMLSVNQLKYELAVLDETMRIHPPTPNGSPRKTPPEGAIIDGHWVVGGVSSFLHTTCRHSDVKKTTVWCGQYNLHHSSSNWTDPEVFVPERWLDDSKYASDDKTAFAPFSLGPRNCIGRK